MLGEYMHYWLEAGALRVGNADRGRVNGPGEKTN